MLSVVVVDDDDDDDDDDVVGLSTSGIEVRRARDVVRLVVAVLAVAVVSLDVVVDDDNDDDDDVVDRGGR